MSETPKQRMMKRLGVLRNEWGSWEQHLRQLSEQILPRRARWNKTDLNRGDRINDNIINSTPLIAARILASGMMAGITSPQRRWFKLTTPDPELAESGDVRGWLHMVEERIRWVYSQSNFYQSLSDGVYPDLGVFSFSCDFLEEHPKVYLHCTPLPIGEYYFATNHDGVVDTIYRDLSMTVRQLVQKFTLEKCSARVRDSYNKGDYDTKVDVIHCVEPNADYEHGRADSAGKAFASTWFEPQARETEAFLHQGGYEEFPALCPRWAVRGNEAYGRSPGMEALGDCKALQHLERRLAALIDKTANPPMAASEAMRGSRQSLLPGDITYVPPGTQNLFQPAIQIPPQAIAALLEHLRRHEDRIQRAFFADLWMRVIADERNERATAREIEEGHQETMLQLGPVLERLNSELLKPAIDRTFGILLRAGILPPPPQELQGMELKVEFESIMHQAQKAVGLAGVRTLVQETAGLAASIPEALDKLNADQIVDEIADMAGVKPELVRSDEEVQALRAARQKQQAAMQAGQAALAATQGAKNLATSPAPSADNMAGNVLSQLGPIANQGFPMPGQGSA